MFEERLRLFKTLFMFVKYLELYLCLRRDSEYLELCVFIQRIWSYGGIIYCCLNHTMVLYIFMWAILDWWSCRGFIYGYLSWSFDGFIKIILVLQHIIFDMLGCKDKWILFIVYYNFNIPSYFVPDDENFKKISYC